ncbi:selenocysteine-specific translation elongation factor [Desulfovibrio sp. OttesenSCG-928-C06]|nr:selenocysteine-specific translation elongation factor [Desulfovibrio sp. OttesenSCG-928-C06]
MPVVMGTAGHIDHGKTSLVRTLTGTDCDRLEEERRRGITIELGFAYLPLPGSDGTADKLSIVDVPGHERFVKNMVAGAAGIDFVTLVIAADEGVMPQTREHLEICSLLGIRSGLVALTKIDMVDEDWLALVIEDIKAFLKGSFLEDAPIFPVSSHTGQGIDALRQALVETAQTYKPRRRGDLPRLPVDRIFTLRGHGTVVTGTLIAGDFKLGEELVLMPGGRSSKVRGLQSHGQSVEKAPAGYRTAVNLPMLEVSDINKGDVLTRPGVLFESDVWLVELQCLSSSPRALRHRAEVHFHHEAREVQARMHFPDREKLQPGESALCQIRFSEPMVGVFGDRCVLRSFSPLRTVAGGFLVHPLPLQLRKKDPSYADKLASLQTLAKAGVDLTPEEAVSAQLALRGQQGASFAELCVLVNFESLLVDKTLQQLGARQQVFMVDKDERRFISAEHVEGLAVSCLDFVGDYHKREPLKAGLGRSALASGWGRELSPKLVHFIIERLLKQGKLQTESDVLRLPGHKVSVDGSAADLRSSLLKAYTEADMTPPNLKELLDELGVSPKEADPVVKLLQGGGELVKVSESIYYAGPVIEKIQDGMREWFATHDDLDLGGLKEITGLSRKYLVALLEYFDRSKFTMRIGNKRVLRAK